MPNQKSIPVPYTTGMLPANPEDLGLAVWEELQRISQALIDTDATFGITITGDDIINVDDPVSYLPLMADNPVIGWENPDGSFSPVDFKVTITREGIYTITVNSLIQPFDTPGDREYYAEVLLTQEHINGDPDTTYLMTAGGLDHQILNVAGSTTLKCLQGDKFYLEGRAVHGKRSGQIDIQTNLQCIRAAAIK